MLDKLNVFVLNGEDDQLVLFSHNQYGTHVFGYKYSSNNITVNGTPPEIKTCTFSCQDQE